MSVSFRRFVQATALAVPLAVMCQQTPAMAAESPDPVVAQAQCNQTTVAHSAMEHCVKHAADLLAQSAPKHNHDVPAPTPERDAPADPSNEAPAATAPAPAPATDAPAAPATDAPAAPATDAPATDAPAAPATAPQQAAPAAPANEAPAKEAPAASPAQPADGPVDALTHLDAYQLLDQLGVSQLLLSLGIDVDQLPIDLHKVLEVKGLLDSLGVYQDLQMLGLDKLVAGLGIVPLLDLLVPVIFTLLGLQYLLKTLPTTPTVG
jgi:hypothetical protein